MDPLSEPSRDEIIRDIHSDVRAILAKLPDLVTQEQRASDRALLDERISQHAQRITALEEGRKAVSRMVLSSFVLPVLVAIVAYFLGQK
jgi:hypothetical protein